MGMHDKTLYRLHVYIMVHVPSFCGFLSFGPAPKYHSGWPIRLRQTYFAASAPRHYTPHLGGIGVVGVRPTLCAATA